MPYRFVITDVFTDRAFGGNQLAVFPDAAGMTDDLMQAWAREFNFSETTFVLAPTKPDHTHNVRIFTPNSELPFAGHPNIGTAVVLAALDAAAGRGGVQRYRFEEHVGTVAIDAEAGAGHGAARLTLERAAEIRPTDVPGSVLAEMLSLPGDALGPKAPWLASIGGPAFFCIPLTSRDAVAGARLDLSQWGRALPPGSWAREVYVIAGEFSPGGRLKTRMWAPAVGVGEDPATGSAAATLVASLAAALPDSAGRFAWTIEQGAEIGRPSLIEAEAEKRDGKVVAVHVGGQAIILAEGQTA